MTNSLRALLFGAIDYAGMFPPASLWLDTATNNYRTYRESSHSWILGRFVCPAERLGELEAMREQDRDFLLAITAAPAVTVKPSNWNNKFTNDLHRTLELLAKHSLKGDVDCLEFRCTPDLPRTDDGRIVGSFARLVAAKSPDIKLWGTTQFFELADPWDLLPSAVDALAVYNQTKAAASFPAGLKLRMGGSALSVPTSAQLADFICACRDARVFWKATAGLHHALPHFDDELGVRLHGFLNIFAAAALADAHRHLHVGIVLEILDDQDASHFQFTDDSLTWCDWSATVDQITVARQRSLRSFGSCSFDEPVQDLRSLGLV